MGSLPCAVGWGYIVFLFILLAGQPWIAAGKAATR